MKKKKKTTHSTVGELKYGEFPFFDGEPNGIAEELDNMRTALKVIYTWASVEQEDLNHHHVMQLIERTLKMKEPSCS